MKYKRVTEYQENTRATIIEPMTLQGIIDYLAELEDKIESGELVEVPKGAVVLTPEERAEEMRLCNEEHKEAVRVFAASVKLAFYYEFDELIPSTMADKIDALVKEVCGGDESNDDRLR